MLKGLTNLKTYRGNARIAFITALLSAVLFIILLGMLRKIDVELHEHMAATPAQTTQSDPRRSSTDSSKFIEQMQLICYIGLLLALSTAAALGKIAIANDQSKDLAHVVDHAKKLAAQLGLTKKTSDETDEIASLDKIMHEVAASISSMTNVLTESKARVRLLIDSMPVALIIISKKG